MAQPEGSANPHPLPTNGVLPHVVMTSIRDRFYAGVTAAENAFGFNCAEEDALTGALAQAIIEPQFVVVETSDGHAFRWRAVSHKLRGRGKGAPEKLIGADGIFQLEIFDRFGRRILRKGLLFQAKVDWRSTDTRLLGQARDMLRQSDSSIVIDYRMKAIRLSPLLSCCR